MNYFWYSYKQKHCHELYPEVSLLLRTFEYIHQLEHEPEHSNFVILTIEGERVEVEYTCWSTSPNHGCKWDDMTLLGTVQGEPEIRIEYEMSPKGRFGTTEGTETHGN